MLLGREVIVVTSVTVGEGKKRRNHLIGSRGPCDSGRGARSPPGTCAVRRRRRISSSRAAPGVSERPGSPQRLVVVSYRARAPAATRIVTPADTRPPGPGKTAALPSGEPRDSIRPRQRPISSRPCSIRSLGSTTSWAPSTSHRCWDRRRPGLRWAADVLLPASVPRARHASTIRTWSAHQLDGSRSSRWCLGGSWSVRPSRRSSTTGQTRSGERAGALRRGRSRRGPMAGGRGSPW